MSDHTIEFLLKQTDAKHAEPLETVQTLWSGYGKIVRYQLEGSNLGTIIVKHIAPPEKMQHPRGWNTDIGHQRKLKSYLVETHWYDHWASRCDSNCYVPKCFGIQQLNGEITILLEDLDDSGFPARKSSLSKAELEPCLSWLAHFHGRFIEAAPCDLWPVGTYWHLDTRPDELAAMKDGPIKDAAYELDRMLNNARYKTLVHGDAKVANFCFSQDDQIVAAVDFQYVGAGCGMKDLAYFMGSCLSETECEELYDHCLERYFELLHSALDRYQIKLDFQALEAEWRSLFPLAWADFERFLMGWMPTHKKRNRFSAALTEQALTQLGKTT